MVGPDRAILSGRDDETLWSGLDRQQQEYIYLYAAELHINLDSVYVGEGHDNRFEDRPDV